MSGGPSKTTPVLVVDEIEPSLDLWVDRLHAGGQKQTITAVMLRAQWRSRAIAEILLGKQRHR